jgi:hypothetical protein
MVSQNSSKVKKDRIRSRTFLWPGKFSMSRIHATKYRLRPHCNTGRILAGLDVGGRDQERYVINASRYEHVVMSQTFLGALIPVRITELRSETDIAWIANSTLCPGHDAQPPSYWSRPVAIKARPCCTLKASNNPLTTTTTFNEHSYSPLRT